MKAVKSAMNDSKADQPQLDKFRELARQLECDEDEARFEDQVRKIASAPKVNDALEPPASQLEAPRQRR